MKDDEKGVTDKVITEKESIKDLDEAMNLLNIYGEDCELRIHKSIREQAFKLFKNLN
ncbi:hypothetical protein [uncultured Paraglaciecola sp.]|uniref:hypothetical protein n=1 Tax=uncultured Paraglaciecola sp. TaxID=1765024 RepID=UPI002619CCEE|nr:hypothetical protein [uncultured Paraglaciecola sp.]